MLLIRLLALMIPIANSEWLSASKESNGSKSSIFQELLQRGFQEETGWQVPLKQEPKEKTMPSGRFSSVLSSSIPSCLRQKTLSIGQSHLKLQSPLQLRTMVKWKASLRQASVPFLRKSYWKTQAWVIQYLLSMMTIICWFQARSCIKQMELQWIQVNIMGLVLECQSTSVIRTLPVLTAQFGNILT